MSNDYPPVAFYFRVSIPGETGTAFQEVSGISMEMNAEEVEEGGSNRFKYKVPTAAKYSNLVLKRGLAAKDSALLKWCTDTLNGDLTQKIEPKSLMVELVNEKGSPSMSWHFVYAYPVKWAVSDLDSMNDEIVIESLEFTYTYFEYTHVSPGGTTIFE